MIPFFMIKIPYNEFDIVAVTDKIKLFEKARLVAQYDDFRREEGIVSIITQNPVKLDSSFVIYEINKVGKKKFIGKKIIWIIRLLTLKDKYSEKIEQGCCYGTSQVKAIFEADKIVLNNFSNILTFEQIIGIEL